VESNEPIRRTLAIVARVFCLSAFAFALRSHLAKGFRMFEAKSGLRNIATTITAVSLSALLVLGTGVGAVHAANQTPQLPATVSYLKTAFSDADIQNRMTTGFALESFIQLAGAGVTAAGLSPAIRNEFTLSNRIFGSSLKPGYLVDPSTQVLKPGLAGKFLYASKVLKARNSSFQKAVVDALADQIAADGAVAASKGNAQDIAWVVLGLRAHGDLAAARRVATALLKLQHTDGGFNYDPTLTVGGTDVTAISIQALKAVPLSNKAGSLKRNAVVAKAVAFLKAATVGGNHFEAWGDVDPNGTAYAIMGLQAAGQNTATYVAWLRSHLQSDGGIEAPWALGVGDRYVTAQGYLPLIGKTYVSLLAGK